MHLFWTEANEKHSNTKKLSGEWIQNILNDICLVNRSGFVWFQALFGSPHPGGSKGTLPGISLTLQRGPGCLGRSPQFMAVTSCSLWGLHSTFLLVRKSPGTRPAGLFWRGARAETTQNLETGKETSSAASLEMERLGVLQAFLDYGLWTSKASQGHCIIKCMVTKMQWKKDQVLFSLMLTWQFLWKVCREICQSPSWVCALVSACFLSQWAL